VRLGQAQAHPVRKPVGHEGISEAFINGIGAIRLPNFWET